MKSVRIESALVAAVVLGLSTGTGAAQQTDAKKDAALLRKTIQQNHFQPSPLDDVKGRAVLTGLLNELDPDRMIFTSEEVSQLSAKSGTIDDDLNGKTWTFLPLFSAQYKRSLERALLFIQQGTQDAIDVQRKEIYPADTLWELSENALEERWRLELKYDIMDMLADNKINAPAISDDEFIRTHEATYRQVIRKNNLRMVNRKLQHAMGFDNYVATAFLRSYAGSYDAHTTYLSARETEIFMEGLTTEGYYFGFTLEEDERGNVIVAELVPGSPAWKSGNIFAGDVIVQLRWEGKEWIDAAGMSLEEVNELLTDANHAAMDFVLRNTGGIQKTVRLRKERMESDDNAVKSFVLKGEHTIGYISLPGFYTDWGEADGSKCASDVALEIIKLKRENMEGLILDLRYNGGGSLQEAVAMAGIFIDGGPIGVVKDKAGEMITVKDMNRGTVYDGPLVLLVNSMSASASEFLAAALQDYRRAIIVGSRTFGKASAQVLYPLDASGTVNPAAGASKGISYASVTVQKIYRITGKTAQQKGVTPDIALPDVLENLDMFEADRSGALASDSIQKKTYYQPFLLLPLRELRYKSEQRTMGNAAFAVTREYRDWITQLVEDPAPVSLYWPDVKKSAASQSAMFHKFDAAMNEANVAFKVNVFGTEQKRMEMDDYVKNFNEVRIKNLEKDISLDEAFHIICDYIAINAKH